MSQRGSSFPFVLEMADLSKIDFDDFLARNRLCPKRVRIITGSRFSRQIANTLARRIRSLPVQLIPNASNALACHERISSRFPRQAGETLVIGIGGGGVLDIAKYHASARREPYLAIPTIVSNDGVASPIAILKDAAGDLKSYSTVPPIGILIDQKILARAPSWALTNGLGDILSNYSALMDWDLAIRHGRARPNALARIMSRSAVQGVLVPASNLRDESFMAPYVDAIVLSGLAMYISGDSRPCSGAEHLIAHVITRHQPSRFGHGFLVGSIAPFVVWLHQRTDRTLLPLARAVGLRLDFASLLASGHSLAALLDEARTIRGPRFTILDQLANAQIEAEYRSYVRALNIRNKRPPASLFGVAAQ